MKKKPLKLNKKKLIMMSVAALATAAVVVGTLIPSASELVLPNKWQDPPAIVLNLDEEAAIQNEESTIESKKVSRLSSRLKTWILNLPQAIRVIFVLPMWGLGWIITSSSSLLWAGIFSPALGFVSSWILGAAVLLGLFALTAKLLFPELSFRKILSKKNIYIVSAVALTIVAIDAIAPYYFGDYTFVAGLVKVSFSFGIVCLLCYRLKKKHSAILS